MACISADFICFSKNTVLLKEILDWSLAEVVVYLRESERGLKKQVLLLNHAHTKILSSTDPFFLHI